MDAADLPDPRDVPGVHPSPRDGEMHESEVGLNMVCVCAESEVPTQRLGLYLGGWQIRTQLLMGTGGLRALLVDDDAPLQNHTELAQESLAYVHREDVEQPTYFDVQATIGPLAPFECPVPLLVVVVESVRNIASDEDAHRSMNTMEWPPDSSHGTSVIEAARLIVPLDIDHSTTMHFEKWLSLKQVEFVSGASGSNVVIGEDYKSNGRIRVVLDVETDEAITREGCHTWQEEEDAFWKKRMWDAFDLVKNMPFEPAYLSTYRPVAIPSWPITYLPPELWALYPLDVQIPPWAAPGTARLQEQLAFLNTALDLGVRTAGSIYGKPDWVREGLLPLKFAHVVGKQVKTQGKKISMDFVCVLEAMMAMVTLLCTPVTPYIMEAGREHYACIAHVSGDCEDFAHFICIFMLTKMLLEIPADVLADQPHLVALRWILRALYYPAQVFYETTAASFTESNPAASRGMAHQACMVLPLKYVTRLTLNGDAPNLLEQLSPTLAWPDATEQRAMGLEISEKAGEEPDWLWNLPCLDGEGTGKTAGMGTPLAWVTDLPDEEIRRMKTHYENLKSVFHMYGTHSFFPTMARANVFGPDFVQSDSFKRHATMAVFAPRPGHYMPVQVAIVSDTNTVGVPYTQLLAGAHTTWEGRFVQATPVVVDIPAYIARAQAAVSATMLSVDRPRLPLSKSKGIVSSLPARPVGNINWETVVANKTAPLPDYGCCVVPLRYAEGVLSRIAQKGAKVCIFSLTSTIFSPACQGVSVMVLFVLPAPS